MFVNPLCDFEYKPRISTTFTEAHNKKQAHVFAWLAGWLAGCLVGCLPGWLIKWLLKWLVGWLALLAPLGGHLGPKGATLRKHVFNPPWRK